MPLWVIVSDDDGEPIVLTDWITMAPRWAPAAEVRARTTQPAIFSDRWRAKRVIQRRGMRRDARVIPLDRL